MAVYVNLDKPLIAQVLVNGLHKKVEYEALPTICFTCRKYRHTKELCASPQSDSAVRKDQKGTTLTKAKSDQGDGLLNPQRRNPEVKALAGRTPVEPAFDIGIVGSTALKAVMDPSSSSMNQPNDVLDLHYTESALQNNESGSSFPFFNDSAFKVSTGQEVSEDGGLALSTKPASSLAQSVSALRSADSGSIDPCAGKRIQE
ncbi:hypothetical protein Gohar_000928 [Gossypium harknessii]|uniref:Zinc knuckle CX2CX4HX4C domain-containing protein n=1 Tax=Gossypium harknessii TaxID=34285 RepID=A0A7J9I281_9ROSI|nr:hypothetical protein [Gossypium harknessii]